LAGGDLFDIRADPVVGGEEDPEADVAVPEQHHVGAGAVPEPADRRRDRLARRHAAEARRARRFLPHHAGHRAARAALPQRHPRPHEDRRPRAPQAVLRGREPVPTGLVTIRHF
jgi:hypothetical protein